MDDKQFRELRTLILDLSVKVESLALAVRTLQRSVESGGDVEILPEDIGDPVDIPDDLKKFFPD
ncbi:hypothetical protein [Rhizobium rhizogenes]|uniref:hypothetical protein n=1 Tax=Rhizobium rhizogenes TaxID=359 RepID=UPI0022C05722|nr:hypothetical protein [Rhizobium rhizogenes]MCZ7488187.1 hypothetical protein [Rhizobium rhizogenes]